MIITWMLYAISLSALAALAAWCAELALRAMGRQARWPWIAAFAVSVVWAVLTPIARWTIVFHPAPTNSAARPLSMTVLADPIVAVSRSHGYSLDAILVGAWIVASAVLTWRLMQTVLSLRVIRNASEERVTDGTVVRITEGVGPAVIGFAHPSVLLPSTLLQLDAPLRRLVITHEREHCAARDPLVVLGVAIANALLPWNVPLWWIGSRARLALEIDCDARVLASGSDATQYGKLLLLIAQQQSVTALAPMLAESTSHLEQRITAMLPRSRKGRRVKIALASAMLGIASVTFVSCTQEMVMAPNPALASSPNLMSRDHVYYEYEVEKQVRQLDRPNDLHYPDALRAANVSGEVLVEFIVDSTGKYRQGSERIIKSSHQLFSNAVKIALPSFVFTPAEIGGRRVAQVVQTPFSFAATNLGDKISDQTTMPVPPNVRASLSALIQGASPVREGTAKMEFEVTRAARQIPGTGRLQYPPSLRTTDVEGEVLVQFVVDTDGVPEVASFKALKSSNPLFTQAVLDALPAIRFQPAEVDGVKVRQLVMQPFTFSLSK